MHFRITSLSELKSNHRNTSRKRPKWRSLLWLFHVRKEELDKVLSEQQICTKTMRSFALYFYHVIVDSSCALVNYHAIELSSSSICLLNCFNTCQNSKVQVPFLYLSKFHSCSYKVDILTVSVLRCKAREVRSTRYDDEGSSLVRALQRN